MVADAKQVADLRWRVDQAIGHVRLGVGHGFVVGDDHRGVGDARGPGRCATDELHVIAQRVLVDEVKHHTVGKLTAERQHLRATAGQPDLDAGPGVAERGTSQLESGAAHRHGSPGEQLAAGEQRVAHRAERPGAVDAERAEREAATRTEAEEGPSVTELVERCDGGGGGGGVPRVGVGDSGAEPDARRGLGDGGKRDVDVAGGKAFVVDPAAGVTERFGGAAERHHL